LSALFQPHKLCQIVFFFFVKKISWVLFIKSSTLCLQKKMKMDLATVKFSLTTLLVLSGKFWFNSYFYFITQIEKKIVFLFSFERMFLCFELVKLPFL